MRQTAGMVTVSGLNITPVKGTQLREVQEIRLGHNGVRENRRFYLVDDQDEMVNSLRRGSSRRPSSPTPIRIAA